MTPAMTGARTPYRNRLTTSLSQTLNVLLNGDSNQTFAARNWDRKKRGLINLVWLIDLFMGRDHCVTEWVTWKVDKWSK